MVQELMDRIAKLLKLFDTPMEPAHPGTRHRARSAPLFEELC